MGRCPDAPWELVAERWLDDSDITAIAALMLAPGCSVPYNAHLGKIRFFLEAAHKYGSYDYIKQ